MQLVNINTKCKPYRMQFQQQSRLNMSAESDVAAATATATGLELLWCGQPREVPERLHSMQ
jgi:hypothetical protein